MEIIIKYIICLSDLYCFHEIEYFVFFVKVLYILPRRKSCNFVKSAKISFFISRMKGVKFFSLLLIKRCFLENIVYYHVSLSFRKQSSALIQHDVKVYAFSLSREGMQAASDYEREVRNTVHSVSSHSFIRLPVYQSKLLSLRFTENPKNGMKLRFSGIFIGFKLSH